MSLEKVKEDIWNAAQKEALRKKRDAESEADAILQRAKETIAELRKAHKEMLKKKKREIEQREAAAARLESRKRVLEFRKQAIDRVFEKASRKLETLAEPKRREYLAALFTSAKRQMDVAKLRCNEKDAKFFKGVNIRNAGLIGGFIAENRDGTLQVDSSFESLLESVKEKHLEKIAQALFGK